METPKIKPCPFCGESQDTYKGERLGPHLVRGDCEEYFVMCHNCGSHGPAHGSSHSSDNAEAFAITSWNKRISVKD